MRRFAQFLAAIAVALSPALARAQACCTATGTSGFGVVGRCHFAVLAAQLSYERGHGSFDANGDYHPLSHAEVDDVVLSLAGGIRLGTPKLQVYGSIPLRLQYRDLEGLSSDSAVGPGDASLALRAMAVEDLVTGIQWSDARSFLPFVEPYVGGRAPTGKGPTESDRPSGVDATGDGTWTAFAGVSVTKFVTLSDAVVLDGSYGYRFEHDVSSPSGGSRRYSPATRSAGDWLWCTSSICSGPGACSPAPLRRPTRAKTATPSPTAAPAECAWAPVCSTTLPTRIGRWGRRCRRTPRRAGWARTFPSRARTHR